MDGDNDLDLAVANSNSNNVSVLLGNGDGTFQARVDYGAGYYPVSVAIGDLNGDEKPDLAVANGGDPYASPPVPGSVSVLLGNGDGSFQARVDYGVGYLPLSVAIGDLNGDEKPDLAVANWNSDNVSVLLGNGDGTFQARVDYGAGDGPVSVVIGDLNGDEKPDLAVANYYSDNVSVLLNNGDGTFPGGHGYLIVSDGTVKYSYQEEAGWQEQGFDDSNWNFVVAPSQGLCPPEPVTVGEPKPIWGENPQEYQTIFVRKAFTLAADARVDIMAGADDDYDLYINGVLIGGNHDGWANSDFYTNIQVQAGENVLAMMATDVAGACQSVTFGVLTPCECIDNDNDGYGNPACGNCTYAEQDCSDTSPQVNPGASEGPFGDPSCSDALDNDCDGAPDTEDSACCQCIDHDSDGYGDPACENCTYDQWDCDNTNPNVNPGASEGPFGDPSCSDALDNDCDWSTDTEDSGCCECVDNDTDGYGDPGCQNCTYDQWDCDDTDANVNPAVPEDCANGMDDDCDGQTDGEDWDCPCIDDDGDGYGVFWNPNCSYWGSDCDDTNPNVNPGASEGPFGDPSCSDALDNDCDWSTDTEDSGCCECVDNDTDGYGDPGCQNCTYDQWDCDDTDANVNPAVPEDCANGMDDDCDGQTDGEDWDCPCIDDDGDGYGVFANPNCTYGWGWYFDCDDTNPQVNPGVREGPFGDLSCSDGLDNDCDFYADQEDGSCCQCIDNDSDGYGDPGCENCTYFWWDCVDSNPNVFPGAPELCDGLDNDCNTLVDEDGCSGEQLVDLSCPCDSDWKNHGEYVSCVAHAAEDQLQAGLITFEEKGAIVSARAKSGCGKKK